MKRFIMLALIALMFTVAIAEPVDWSDTTTESLQATIADLEAMLDSAKAELARRGQGEAGTASEGVRVPIGVWFVGEDIPEGHYTINVAPDAYMSWGSIKIGTALDSTGKDIDGFQSKKHYYEQVKKKGSDAAVTLEEIDYDFKNGDILIVEEADMIFTPYVKKKLGF